MTPLFCNGRSWAGFHCRHYGQTLEIYTRTQSYHCITSINWFIEINQITYYLRHIHGTNSLDTRKRKNFPLTNMVWSNLSTAPNTIHLGKTVELVRSKTCFESICVHLTLGKFFKFFFFFNLRHKRTLIISKCNKLSIMCEAIVKYESPDQLPMFDCFATECSDRLKPNDNDSWWIFSAVLKNEKEKWKG